MSEKLNLEWVENAAKHDIDSGEVTVENGIVGEPRAQYDISPEKLCEMGAVGIYKREGDENFRIIYSPTSSRLDYMGPLPRLKADLG
jgi:hypothetical protein